MMINPHWFLSDSHRVRYVTGALAYFAQGIPKGLLHIALPAWLAAEGVAPAAIAGYLGVIMLPWAFKLLVGLLMALGFVINAFTAAQDVAVDGVSIDLVPLEEEAA